jgi:hypothetical protein
VRQQLLFAPGDAWSGRLGRESARNLRALRFLEPLRVEARPAGDSADVLVETRDYWTTRPEVNLETSGDTRYGSVGLTERNLLGLGKSLSFAFRSQPSGNSRLLSYEDPGVLGSRHRIWVRITRGDQEASDRYHVQLPFYSQDAPRAYGAAFERVRAVPRLYQGGVEAARFDQRTQAAEVSWGTRIGDHESVRRLEFSFESADKVLGPSQLAPGAAPAFDGGLEDLRLRRWSAQWSVWRPHFLERVDIERMTRIEDFDVGTRLELKAGVSPRLLGSGKDEGHLRARLDAGAASRIGFGWMSCSASGRFLPEARDLVVRLDARWYTLALPAHAVVVAVQGVAADRVSRDFQAVVGGLTGLRAYPVHAVAGRRLWRLNLEDRWRLSPASWELVKLGSAVFLDAARAWGLGAAGTDWHHDAGLGLRVGLPVLGVAEVLRVDVAWPLVPTRDGRRDPVLSVGSSQAF